MVTLTCNGHCAKQEASCGILEQLKVMHARAVSSSSL